MAVLSTLINVLKLLKNLKTKIFFFFVLSYRIVGSYWILWNRMKINSIFLNYNSYRIVVWKVNVFNSCMSEISFRQTFLDTDLYLFCDLSKIQIYVLVYLPSSNRLWQYLKVFSPYFLNIVIEVPSYNTYGICCF